MNMHTLTRTVAVVLALSAGFVFAGEAEAQRRSDTSIVLAQDMNTYVETFRAGQPVTLHVVGDGDTDLDLFVFDENDNLIAFDVNPTDIVSVSWTPRWTGNFTIVVLNHGRVYNQYRIWTE